MKYLIKLTPLGPFFFGGKKRSEAESETDYYLKSRYFPRQTVLLGMLRHELLMQNQCFPLNKENRGRGALLIGKSSFNPEAPDQDFGLIREISPLFFIRYEKKDGNIKSYYYHFAPRDHGLVLESNEENHRFKDFKPKDFKPLRLMPTNREKKAIPIHTFLKQVDQVGIKKSQTGKTEEDAYYKQVFYRLARDISFAFYLRLSIPGESDQTELLLNNPPLRDNVVFMGGERSAFKMEINRIREDQEEISVQTLYEATLPVFTPHRQYSRIILTGDAFIDLNRLKECKLKFRINSSEFFRNIRTHVESTRKFYNLARSDSNPGISSDSPYLGQHYNLMTRGSVLYCLPEDAGQLCCTIANSSEKPHFRKIGFNYYIKVNPGREK